MDVDNQWPENKLDARAVIARLEEFAPMGVAFYADEGLPWVHVHYDYIVLPEQVVPIGEAIYEATGRAVFFQALRAYSIHYILDDESLREENDPRLHAKDYGISLSELGDAWKLISRSR